MKSKSSTVANEMYVSQQLTVLTNEQFQSLEVEFYGANRKATGRIRLY